MQRYRAALFTGLLVAAFALTRWPGLMPYNFSFVYGFVFCAALFPRILPAWALFGTLVATDVLANVFYYQTNAFSDYMLANYAAYACIFLLGKCMPPAASLSRIVGGGLIGALLFYLVTNTAAWLYNPEYPSTLGGWLQALTLGTSGWPETWKFFRNTLLSGGLFTGFTAAFIRAFAPEPPELEPVSQSEPSETAEPATAAEDES